MLSAGELLEAIQDQKHKLIVASQKRPKDMHEIDAEQARLISLQRKALSVIASYDQEHDTNFLLAISNGRRRIEAA